MSHRRIVSVAGLMTAGVAVVIGLTGALQTRAATGFHPGKLSSANPPNGPRTAVPLDRLRPARQDDVALKWSEERVGMIRFSTLPPTAVSRVPAMVHASVFALTRPDQFPVARPDRTSDDREQAQNIVRFGTAGA